MVYLLLYHTIREEIYIRGLQLNFQFCESTCRRTRTVHKKTYSQYFVNFYQKQRLPIFGFTKCCESAIPYLIRIPQTNFKTNSQRFTSDCE